MKDVKMCHFLYSFNFIPTFQNNVSEQNKYKRSDC